MVSIEAGTVLAGRYRLERELGRGGMGAVWAGHDEKLRRPVAIKVMTERIAESESALQRFEREAMAVARLRSPYIVQVHDYGVDDDRPFIVMELIEGEDLKALLAREKRLSIEDTAKIVVQVAKALHAAHQSGIVHRDLKPGNVFLAHEHDDVTAKVFDFGVAKALTDLGEGTDSDMTGEGQLLGTPRYMSPEQAYGAKRVDHRSDLWALGVIAYYCITGRPPFVAAGTGHVLVKICTESATPPSELIGHLSAEVDAFFEEALAKEPDERFQSARELATQFAQLADLSMSTFGLNVSEPTPSWQGAPAFALPSDPSAATRAEGSQSDASAKDGAPASGSSAPAGATTGRNMPENGTLGPATTTLAGPRSWFRSGRGLLAAVLTGALIVGGAIWVATRGDGASDTTQAPTRAEAAEDQGKQAGAEPADSKPTSQDPPENDSAAPEPSGQPSASDRSAKGPDEPPKPAAGTKKPPAAKPKDSTPAPPTTTSPPPEKSAKSKDGLDLFNKRW